MSHGRVRTAQFEKSYECTCEKGSEEIVPYLVSLDPGFYKIELWGASGGGASKYNSRGGYSAAFINVTTLLNFYLYIGGEGSYSNTINAPGGCNGGGYGYRGTLNVNNYNGGGGGSTDARYNDSIYSRFMVASGGGGGGIYDSSQYYGGGGGAENGLDGIGWGEIAGLGASQESGGGGGIWKEFVGEAGKIWKGGDSIGQHFPGGGGGGGYYGGGGSYEGGGGGGSGFISKLIKGFLKGSNESFPSFTKGTEIGHFGNGAARITLLNGKQMKTCHITRSYNSLRFMLYLVIYS